MTDALLEVRGLTRRFGGLLAVDDVSFEVRPGEVVGLLGPNGAGKTTTMRILLGLLPADAGEVRVAGHPPGHPDGLHRVGALVEEPAHYPYLSGRDNLRVLASLAGVPRERVDEVLDTVELTTRADDKMKTYSLGMRQRLGVAAALLKNPPLLVLDEPTNGLDPQGMTAMRAMLRRLGTGDRAVLLSSHLLGEVQQVCDRAVVIHRGRVVVSGPVSELRGASVLRVVAEPSGDAEQICARFGPTSRDAERIITVDIAETQVPDLADALVEAGVRVFELRRDQRSLEEAFLEITRSETV